MRTIVLSDKQFETLHQVLHDAHEEAQEVLHFWEGDDGDSSELAEELRDIAEVLDVVRRFA